jgi:hypothetical protein
MKKAVLITVLCLVAAAPAFAAGVAIRSGIDIWTTKADGRTHWDFSSNPIPSGFFCASSAPFSDIIFFRGAPLATSTPGALGTTDTIVQRLDDVAFEKSNVATTRIQLRALSLVNMFPVKTSCGSFNVKATLDGDQPITTMRIFRESKSGGRYVAPLALNVKMVFTPVDNPSARPLVLRKNIQFKASPSSRWTNQPSGLVTHEGFVKVDTDGDGVPDAFLEGTTANFSAARNPLTKAAGGDCHCADDACSEMHCPDGTILFAMQ